MPTASNTDRLLRTQKAMAGHAARALTRFTILNPRFQGAQWADCLDLLLDADSHLDLTEPLYDELADKVSEEQRPFISLVAVTLLWSTGTWPVPEGERISANVTAADVAEWLEVLA